jgi:transglutaminase-like putative cysteine protease
VNGRTRIALHAASATLLTALCLWPLVTPASTWLVPAALMLAVVTAAGLGLRRLGAPLPLVPVFQLLVLLLLLTVGFAREQAVLGVLPGPGAFTQFSDLVSQGTQDMSQYSAPAPAHSGLTLILVGSVTLIGLLVDALAVTFQRVALTGLPLLALYSVGTGLHSSGPIWLWFLLASGGYLSLLMAEGRDRLSRWGRVFHGNSGPFVGMPGGNPLNATGYRIAGVALVFGLLLPVALPSLGDGLIGRIGGSSSGLGGNSIKTAVNPLASIAQTLTQPADQTVLTYTSTSNSRSDQYLRIVDLDQFDGIAWTTSKHEVEKVPSPLPTPDGLGAGVPQATMSTTVTTASSYAQQWLPMPYPVTGLQVNGDWEYEPEGRTLIGGTDDTTTAGLKYTVTSLLLQPTAQQLADAPPPSAAMLKTYTQLPSDLPAVVHADALAVTLGATSAYAKAVDLQNWFTTNGGFTYNTSVAYPTGLNSMADFLKEKQGFCVHFAATMAAMARSLGIPARVDIGFAPGTQQPDGTWVVSTKDAHAWPELYFSGIGWLRFEPTPTIGVAPNYTVNTSGSGSISISATSPTSSATAPVSKPAKSSGCPLPLERVGGCGGDNAASGPAGAQAASGLSPLELALIAAGGLALLLLLLPMLWRQWTRRARLRSQPGGRSATDPFELSEQQVLAVWQEMIDSAWDLGIPPDAGETPRRTAARLAELGELGAEQRDAVGRVALATEQVLYAPSADTPVSLRQDLRTVRSGLHASADRRTRIRALLLPPSGVQVGRRLRESLRSAVDRAVWGPLRAARGGTAAGLRRLARLPGRLRRGGRED